MSNEELVKLVFELVMKEIARLEAEQARGAGDTSSIEISKQVLSESDVRNAHRSGACGIIVHEKAIITCLAAEYANKQGISITRKT